MRSKSVQTHLREKLKDPYFKELYELEEQKLEIIKKIVGHRVKFGLNQKELADKVGVTQQFISKVENGEFSNVVTLQKILFVLGYTINIEVLPLKSEIKQAVKSHVLKKSAPRTTAKKISGAARKRGTAKRTSRISRSRKLHRSN